MLLDLTRPNHKAPPVFRLRRQWWERWDALQRPPLPNVTLGHLNRAVRVGGDLIEEYASELEGEGWQPVHLLRPPGPNDRGGLAWRWPAAPVIRRVKGMFLAARIPLDRPDACWGDWADGVVWMAYRALRDGSVKMLVGEARSAALDAMELPWKIQALPAKEAPAVGSQKREETPACQ